MNNFGKKLIPKSYIDLAFNYYLIIAIRKNKTAHNNEYEIIAPFGMLRLIYESLAAKTNKKPLT